MFGFRKYMVLPRPEEALPGREQAMAVPARHFVNGHPLLPPFPDGTELALFGLGCFWGAERIYWGIPGTYSTAVGYAAGYTPNPNYREVCTGMTGHNEVVRVVYESRKVGYEQLLKIFWESHDPTQGTRQGNDVGTQYRSAIFYESEAQRGSAERKIEEITRAGIWPDAIVTEVASLEEFYPGEVYHDDYFQRNPNQGYCQAVVAPKVAKFRKQHLDRLKRQPSA